jgi:hypothetical protein
MRAGNQPGHSKRPAFSELTEIAFAQSARTNLRRFHRRHSMMGYYRPARHALTWHDVFWSALGGLFYTAGIVLYAFERLSYFHAYWHLFVLAGSTRHFFAVLFYVAEPRT